MKSEKVLNEIPKPVWEGERPESASLWRPYCQMKTAASPFEVVSAEGVFLQLADGRKIIDGIASWWTACHGHRHPHLVDGIKRQLDQLPHVMMGGIVHPQALRLADRLATLLPGDLNHVFFVDSGSVAIEVAMKMAVQYWMNRGERGRHRFVCFQNSYHGDTSGAMSLCDPQDSMHAHFKGFLTEQFPSKIPESPAEFEQFQNFLQANQGRIAGVVIEPLIQAAGGFRFHSPEQLSRIAAATRATNCLLIADEIATGFGRTGRMFAVEHAGIVPDIMCIGKGLTGATISLAATVARDPIFEAFLSDDPNHALMHGPTFMGNPLACAAANASLDLFEMEPRLEQAGNIESFCKKELEPLLGAPHVIDVRVCGAFAAVQVDRVLPKSPWMEFFVDQGVWLRPTRDVFYLAPPLTIQPRELGQLCRAIQSAVDHLRTRIG